MNVGGANRLRSLAYAAVFYVGSIPYCIAAVLFGRYSARAAIAIPRAWANYQDWCARWLMGTRLVIDGVFPQNPVIVAMKHETFYETFQTLRLFDRPAVVFKAELLKVPLWGEAARLNGVIPIEREAGAKALRQLLVAGRAAIADGRPIVIFPEGTRVPHGDAPQLRPGIAGLYKLLALPIVPIAVDSGRVWGWKSFWKRSGVITFHVGETIPIGLHRDEVEARVHAAINALNR